MPGAPSLGRDHGHGHPHPWTVETDRGGWPSLDDRTSKDDALAGTPEEYLRPEVIRQVARLDLRAKFIVEGFIAGLHVSPFHGFSVEFSEHRRYTSGDNIADIDWNDFAKTDRFYIKKFQAETNLTGYLVMDLSGSMGYTYRQERGHASIGKKLYAKGRRTGVAKNPSSRSLQISAISSDFASL